MPKWTPNTNNVISKMCQEKQQLEVELGKKIMDAFAKPALIDPIRALCAYAATEMVADDAAVKAATKGAIEEETKANNAFVKNPEFVKAVAGTKNEMSTKILTTFAPTDCSNVIRLYGCFIEKFDAAKKGTKDSLRIDFANRNRYRDGAQLDDLKKALDARKGATPFVKNLIAKYETGGMSEYYGVQQDLVKMNGGQAQWRLEFDSRICKLDTWFGFVGASDISGTTTDTLYFLNECDKNAETTDPLYRMLPLGTIVSGAHHSFLEVALPLAQNGFCDYALGKYSSAMVKDAAHPSKGEIQGLLTAAENDKRNHMICVGYSGDFKIIQDIIKAKKEDAKKDPKTDKSYGVSKAAGYKDLLKTIKVEGAYVFDGGEKAAFYAMANAKKLHVAMDKENAWPTQANVREFLKKNGFPKVE